VIFPALMSLSQIIQIFRQLISHQPEMISGYKPFQFVQYFGIHDNALHGK